MTIINSTKYGYSDSGDGEMHTPKPHSSKNKIK